MDKPRAENILGLLEEESVRKTRAFDQTRLIKERG